MKVRDTRPREVMCVTCGAFRGGACITPSGHITRNHRARVEWAAQHITEVHPDGANVVVRRAARYARVAS